MHLVHALYVPSVLTEHHSSSVFCTSQMCHVTTSWWPVGGGTTYSAAHFCLHTCTPWHAELLSVPEMPGNVQYTLNFLVQQKMYVTQCILLHKIFRKCPGNWQNIPGHLLNHIMSGYLQYFLVHVQCSIFPYIIVT